MAQDRIAFAPASYSTKLDAPSNPNTASYGLGSGDPGNSLANRSGGCASSAEETQRPKGKSLA
jgi:hypothetical protein